MGPTMAACPQSPVISVWSLFFAILVGMLSFGAGGASLPTHILAGHSRGRQSREQGGARGSGLLFALGSAFTRTSLGVHCFTAERSFSFRFSQAGASPTSPLEFSLITASSGSL